MNPITVHDLPRAEIRPCPFNPRKHFDDEKLNELALNIRRFGVIQPLTVRIREGTEECPLARFEIICGEQRWRACGERPHPTHPESLPAMESMPCIVRELSDVDALAIMLSENLQRRDLTELEEADAFAAALAQTGPDGTPAYATAAIFAETLGVSPDYVTQRLLLRKMPAAGRKALESGRITFATARVIARVPEKIMEPLIDVVLHPAKHEVWTGSEYAREPLTADQVREQIAVRFLRRLSRAAWPLDDGGIMPEVWKDGVRLEGGKCSDCPWNTANQEQPGESKSTGGRRAGSIEKSCLNPACFSRKLEIFAASELVKAREAGCETLGETEAAAILGPDGELTVGCGYVELSAVPAISERNGHIPDAEMPTWERLVMDGAARPPVIALADSTGRVRRVVERRLAILAAQTNGTAHFLALTKGGGRSMMDEDVKSEKEAAKTEARARSAAALANMAALVDAVESADPPEEFWKWLAGIAAWHGGADAGNFVVKRRELPGTGHYSEAVEKHLRALGPDQLRGLAVELLAARLVKFEGINEPHFRQICKLYGVKPAAVERPARPPKAGDEKPPDPPAPPPPDPAPDIYEQRVAALRAVVKPGAQLSVAKIQTILKLGYRVAKTLSDAMTAAGDLEHGHLADPAK